MKYYKTIVLLSLLYPFWATANFYTNGLSLLKDTKKHYIAFQVARGIRHVGFERLYGNMNSYMDSTKDRRVINFGVAYLYNISKNFSIDINFLIQYSTFSYRTYIEPDSPDSNRSWMAEYGWSATDKIPINIYYNYEINEKLKIFCKAGFTIGASVNTFRKDTFYHYASLLPPSDTSFTVSVSSHADAKYNLKRHPSLYLFLGAGIDYNIRKNNYLRFYITASSLIKKNYYTSDRRYYHIDVRTNEVIGIDRIYRKGREIFFGLAYIKELNWGKKKKG